MKHYKCIHFFWHNDLKFSPRVVKMINNAEYGFSKEDHLFVTPYKKVYETLSSYANVVLYEMKDPFSAQMINHFAPYGDWLFVHSIPDWKKAFFIRKKYQKKIIWRTWGHDSNLLDVKRGSFIKRLLKKIFNIVKIREVRRFYAVGVSSIYIDNVDIEEKYGNVRTLDVPYVENIEYENKTDFLIEKHDCLNIMVGHSGTSLDNHIAILNLLKRFENREIKIYLVLSYGAPEYIKSVYDYVENNWKDKVEIVSEFMSLSKFLNFCSKMDVGIFDGKASYAIGNISVLLGFRKKLFFNREGLWHRAFLGKNAPHFCTDELSDMSFEDLKSPVIYSKDRYDGLEEKQFDEYVDGWKKMLEALNKARK